VTIWRSLRFLLPFLEQFAANAQLFSNLGHWFARPHQFDGLGFKISGKSLAELRVQSG
jgi:hypothetical protein